MHFGDTMKTIVPDYYPRFQCIADRCQHSCCIGWEIDIDEETLVRYQAVDGEMGQRLKSHIDTSDDCPHFILGEGERCPFLNGQNLCDLIVDLGEDSLCQICADHPRFCNDFSDRRELGLGLCCEAAAALIVTNPDPIRLITLADDGLDTPADAEEQYLTDVRNQAISIVQDREFSVAERMEHLAAFFDFPVPEYPQKWAEIFLDFERLDEAWTTLLHSLEAPVPDCTFPELETAWEQLLVYFLFRHLPAAYNDGDVESKLAFAVLSVKLLQWLCAANNRGDLESLLEYARMYSAEIEYSDENLDILFDCLSAYDES